MEKIHWEKLLTGNYSITEVIDFLRAELRYFVYYKYNHIQWLMQDHIKEQIDFRIDVMMDRQCYREGQCKVCGCTTPDLQFTNASCKDACYPPLVDKDIWQQFKEMNGTITDNDLNIRWYNMNHGIIKFTRLNKSLIIKRKI